MRFDDSLTTILAAGRAPGVGARSTWRQLVDLIGRRRIDAHDRTIAVLRALRPDVPVEIRAASIRGLRRTVPPAALIALLVEDVPQVVLPLLRAVTLTADDWLAILPRLDADHRAVLRDRDDLPAAAALALSGGDRDVAAALPPAAPPATIADLVQRLDAVRRDHAAPPPPAAPLPDGFTFDTDAAGVIRHVEGIVPGVLVGVSLARTGATGAVRLDAAAAGALDRRRGFSDARLEIVGPSAAAGSWRLSATPLFDPATGRFTGYHGVGRRPRRDEQAERRASAADSLRQLVHELRTPSNAIIGFAELIDTEMLGPVPEAGRARAGAIREQASALVGAIDDLDIAARIDGDALDLRPGTVPLQPLLAAIVADLTPLATMRDVTLTLTAVDPAPAASTDDRATERLVSRLLAATIATAAPGDDITLAAGIDGGVALIEILRPPVGELNDAGDEASAPLLGIDFTLRLVRNLAVELGGELRIAPTRLALHLPLAGDQPIGHAAAR